MPFVAIVPVLGLLATSAITATGQVVRCYVLRSICRQEFAGNEPFAAEDLASSIIPSLNETVMLRAESEGLLSTAANTGYCGVPQYNFDMCQNDLRYVTIQTSIPARGVARFDNVPPTCMVLSTVLTGGCGVAPPYPLVCGSACLQYADLSEAQLIQLGDALRPKIRAV
ncbi:hypothetical protein ColLi_11892 [Colletotrichum liriopes]|uniref:Uncharacterized protein n=1 Tax=Colletotrichum liriopes TaxID=708192 RepID=A0AA37GXB7_9PEZI|nr:hypothetical protein ColLi_11892 [Colletotrichum liriopes]